MAGTISMKIGRYDRAPALLASQDTKAANGRINWSPAMLDTIRSTRERAAEMAAAAGGGSSLLTKLWRQEWEAAFPELRDVDWRQVVSRYHYHFGAERRESGDGGVVEMSTGGKLCPGIIITSEQRGGRVVME